ncbi:MAG: Fic family protein [Lactobacillales bacterium]|jgi:Fic family protein|nr:Fic family protein [Lactobacillales bacterium]
MVDYAKIDQLKAKMDSFRPLDQVQAKLLWKNYRIEETHSSTWLEGNTLTLDETRVALEMGITIAQKPIKDYLELIDYSEALDYMKELAVNSEKQVFSERMIREVNYLVYHRTKRVSEVAGVYRAVPVIVGRYKPPQPFLVKPQMEEFVRWVNDEGQHLHPVQLASEIHQRFVTIHPFINGNGRTARLLLNFQLTKTGFPPIYVKPNEKMRGAYNKALYETQKTPDASLEPFNQFIADIVEDTLHKQIEILKLNEQNLQDFNQINTDFK